MTLPLYLGVTPSGDGTFHGTLSIGDAHLTVRKWKREDNGTVSAEVEQDAEWTQFMARMTALVSG